MYFWNVRGLKQQLRSGIGTGLASRYLLAYLVAPVLIGMLLHAAMLPIMRGGIEHLDEATFREAWDRALRTWHFAWFGLLPDAALVAAYGVGIPHCHRCNGGEAGRDFLTRLLALVWVIGVRSYVLLGIPAWLVVALVTKAVAADDSLGSGIASLGTPLLVAVILWRVGLHLRDLAGTDPTTT